MGDVRKVSSYGVLMFGLSVGFLCVSYCLSRTFDRVYFGTLSVSLSRGRKCIMLHEICYLVSGHEDRI